MTRRGASNKATLTTEFVGDNTDLVQKADEAATAVEQAFGRIDVTEAGEDLAEQLIKGATAVGIGAFLTDGILDNLDLGPVQSKVQAQLGLTATEAGRVGDLGAGLFREAWGESTEETTQAIGRVASQLVDLNTTSDEELTALTQKALAVAETWDLDFNEVIRGSSQLLENGLAPTAEAALDLVARSMVNTQDASDDLLDTLNEYSPQFAAIGLEGDEALGILNRGVELGVINTDKLADAIKEFRVRAVEDNDEVAEAFDDIGLEASKVATAIAAGGPQARDAYTQVVTAIQSVEDPLEQQRIATVLFGTAFEDLGPRALEALNPVTSALGEVDGAAQGVADTLGNNAATSIDEFQRKAGAVSDELTQSFAPALGTGAEFGSRLLDVVLDLPEPLQATAGGMLAVGGVAVPALSAIGELGVGVGGFSTLLATARDRAGDRGLASAIGRSTAAMAGFAGATTIAVSVLDALTHESEVAEQRADRLNDAFHAQVSVMQAEVEAFLNAELGATGASEAFTRAGFELDAITEILATGTDEFAEWQKQVDEFRDDLISDRIRKMSDEILDNRGEWADWAVQLAEAVRAGEITEIQAGLLVEALDESADAFDDNRDRLREWAFELLRTADAQELVTDTQREQIVSQLDGAETAGEYLSVIERLRTSIGETTAETDAFAEAERKARDLANDLTESLQSQVGVTVTLNDLLEDAANARLEAFDSELAYENQVARTASELARYAEVSGDVNATAADQEQALRDAQRAALSQAASAVAAADAQAELSGTTLTANERIAIQVGELGAVAFALDPANPLRTELSAYITDLSAIPTQVFTEIGVNLDDTSVQTMLDTLQDLVRRRDVPFFIPGVAMATGGILEDNSSSFIARAGTPMRLFNEPLADGGESFIRLDGSDRSRQILAETADALGVPLGGSGGGGGVVGIARGGDTNIQIVVNDANSVDARRAGRRIARELGAHNRMNGPIDISTRRSRGGGG